MTFVSTLALAIALLAVGPYLAHKIRRWRATEEWFPPARLVVAVAPQARRRSKLEAPTLFGVRLTQVLALALLGATPFVRCSRLSLDRPGGASIAMAIVLDDSMSMRADEKGKSRFERARSGARELLSSALEGDAVAIVLAGAPARVALAATTDRHAARQTIDAMAQSDRATDLEGALALADGLLGSLPQPDKRIILLSDLADGRADGPPLADANGLPLWVPLPEIQGAAPDCAVLTADRLGARVHVSTACGPGQHATGRELVVEDPSGNSLARAAVDAGNDATLLVPGDASKAHHVRMLGTDAIPNDDVAPLVSASRRGGVAVVETASTDPAMTGGPPAVEQALEALRLDEEITPLPALPDTVADLATESGIVLDDPPGLTPEQRQALGGFLQGGGVVLLALGERAAAEPLGATLEPILEHAVSWAPMRIAGARVASALDPLAEGAETLVDLGATHRTTLPPEDAALFQTLVEWSDGPPLVARRSIGRGEAWIVTLPFSIATSDLPLRPGFVALLGAWTELAHRRAVPVRSEVGAAWKLASGEGKEAEATVQGPEGPLLPTRSGDAVTFIPPVLGAYEIVDGAGKQGQGARETRVAMPSEKELDLRPRNVAMATGIGRGGGRQVPVDTSPYIALAVLALVAAEMALRGMAPAPATARSIRAG